MKKKMIDEWERMNESGYDWPKPIRISIYIYPAQLKMIEEIARTWKQKKRDVFLQAIQTHIGFYANWKADKTGKPR